MPVKIRLQRHGRKRNAYYYIVVADSRSPRDGKFIERLGAYDPNTNPATIELDNERALSWLDKGAQPTDTARAILSYKGVMYRKHLERGIRKGALTQEEADRKFADWLDTKASQINQKIEGLKESANKETRTRLERESAVATKRAEELRAKRAAAEAPEAVAEESTEGGEEGETQEEA
jgi:small subunit ribosomal protein S16